MNPVACSPASFVAIRYMPDGSSWLLTFSDKEVTLSRRWFHEFLGFLYVLQVIHQAGGTKYQPGGFSSACAGKWSFCVYDRIVLGEVPYPDDGSTWLEGRLDEVFALLSAINRLGIAPHYQGL